MTIGERLLQLRKQHNLSQEELGKKLMVSRQTISLWETDQTMPTVDNLLKLKEIYGVSVDGILCEAENMAPEYTAEPSPKPMERYEFTYTIQELKKLYSGLNRSFYIKNIVGITLFAILAVIQVAVDNQFWTGIFFALFFIFLILFTKSHTKLKRTNSIAYNRISLSEYIFEFFSEHFTVSIHRGGDLVRFQRIRYDEIEQYRLTKEYCVIVYSSQTYVLRLCDIAENSLIMKHICGDKSNKTK